MLSIHRMNHIWLGLGLMLLLSIGCRSHQKPIPGDKPRVVALTPSLASALYAVDPEANLVATSRFTRYPEAAIKVATLPQQSALEQIVALQPDLVLLHPSDTQTAEKLLRLGIDTRAYGMDTIADIEAAVIGIGDAIKQPEAAQQAIENLNKEMQQARSAYAQNKNLPSPRVLLIIDFLDMRAQRIFVAQNRAYLADLVRDCGADAIPIANNTEDWAQIGAELLLTLNPPHVLILGHSPDDAAQKRTTFETVYPTLSAVQHGRIVTLDDPDLSVPDMRLPQTLHALCTAMAPFFSPPPSAHLTP